MNSPLNKISTLMVERYSKRYREMGYDVKTLGWGNTEQQHYRFNQALEQLQFTGGKTILDIGCGFGDFLALLIAENKQIKNYIGWDINPDLISEAKKIWANQSMQTNFEVVNIGDYVIKNPIADIGVLFGLLNLNLKEEFDNVQYSKIFIENAFNAVNDVLVVDFLSTLITSDYPKEDFVFYHNPSQMMEFALSLTPNVVLKHNYAPIPQKEFMLFLYK